MGRFDKVLLCTDLDGTLLNSKGELSEQNRKAIQYFQSEGGKFCISTGRLANHLLKFFEREEFNCPTICCNGACIYDYGEDKILYNGFLGKGALDTADILLENKEKINSVYFFNQQGKYSTDNLEKDFSEIKKTLEGNVYKMVIVMNNEGEARMLRDYLREVFSDEFNISRSWRTGIEMINKKSTKGESVKRLSSLLGGGYMSVCVGDYENDITMIESADIGLAVENAAQDLKAAADKVICSNNEHAIKYIVEEILKNK